MLFFGNVENTLVDYKNLQNLSLFFDVSLKQKEKSIGWINPENYYPEDDYNNNPLLTWRGHANGLYTNWLNYYVYQVTPYEL